MKPTVAHAAARAVVTFPGQHPGTTMTGRLVAVKRGRCRIQLRPGAWVTRPLDVVEVAPEPKETP